MLQDKTCILEEALESHDVIPNHNQLSHLQGFGGT
jgi:hypothetical protein